MGESTAGVALRGAAEVVVNECLDRIRAHPFIVDAAMGRLEKFKAERWIKCAGRESRSFPDILTNMLETVEVPEIREVLAKNLGDEYGGGDPDHAHFKHYLHLLDNLGIPRSDFMDYDEGPGIRTALATAYNVSKSRNLPLAMGYMLVNEGMTPITYGAAQAGLLKYYPALDTTFFRIHVGIDAEHVEQLYRSVEHLYEADEENLRFGIALGERGMAALLDEAYGLFDYCQFLPAYETNIEMQSAL